MKKLTLNKLPIRLLHREGDLGKIKHSWIDSNDEMRIIGDIDTNDENGKRAALDIISKKYDGLSLSHLYELQTEPKRRAYKERKKVIEVSLVPREQTGRPGCVIQYGAFVTNEAENSISDFPNIDNQKQMANLDEVAKLKAELELLQKNDKVLKETLQQFTVDADKKEVENKKLIESREAEHKKAMNIYFEREQERLKQAQANLLGVLGNSENIKKATENMSSLANNFENLEKVTQFYSEVCANLMNINQRNAVEEQVAKRKRAALEASNYSRVEELKKDSESAYGTRLKAVLQELEKQYELGL